MLKESKKNLNADQVAIKFSFSFNIIKFFFSSFWPRNRKPETKPTEEIYF